MTGILSFFKEFKEHLLGAGSNQVAAAEGTPMVVKIAEINALTDMTQIKSEVSHGNMVIIDTKTLNQDKITYEQIVRELSDLTAQIGGDIVGLGNADYIILTPITVKISRKKLVPALSGKMQ